MGLNPTLQLDALDGFIIPMSIKDWTPETIANMKQFANRDGVDTFQDADAWMDANQWAGIMPPAPRDWTRPFQPWRMRPGLVPQGSKWLMLNAIPANTTPSKTGGNIGQNPPETFVQPGGTTGPSLTLQVLGTDLALTMAERAGYFANGVASFTWVLNTDSALYTANFFENGFTQIPLGWDGLPDGYGWDRRFIPYITGDGRVRCVKFQDVNKLPKFGAPQPAANAPLVYANDGATTATVIMALQAAGLSGAVLGDAVNAAARKTK